MSNAGTGAAGWGKALRQAGLLGRLQVARCGR